MRCIFFCFALITSLSLSGQVKQSARLELPLYQGESKFEIVPSSNRGLYLYRWISTDQADALELIKLDTAFSVIWRGFLPLDQHLKFLSLKVARDNFYVLFRRENQGRNNFSLYAIEGRTGNFIRHDIKNYITFTPLEFQVTDSAALMAGYFNRVPVVTHFDFRSNRSKILPGLLNEIGELTQVKTNDDGSFNVLIAARNYAGQKTIWIKTYDPSGKLLSNIPLESEDNKTLIFARSLKMENNVQIVAGVFGAQRSDYSRGFFMASIDPSSGMQQIRYYNFHELQNFFKYMKAKREIRVKKRIERRKIKGKRIKFNYRFLVHELVPHNGQFILLGEAFYPHYITADRSGFGFFSPYAYSGAQQLRDGRIFDGYYYTHAVVMGFDVNGDIIWDNSFEINDVKTYTLEQFVRLEIQDDKIVLLYLYENELRTKIIEGNNVVEGKTIEPLTTSSEMDEILKEDHEKGDLNYWYQSFFYAAGIQEINNPKLGRRRVFYVNKISYDF
ncbi:hypothetical protein [Pseudochryseolinea flava]|uniref:Uncharacterized protein n=1 Tax=Pseudochryseolinea flava TaxID=2059302 RepID=A0A364XZ95_9BACT|nr:hypothetical protein [Pseudochryseolinea flava]RAV99803.1 hypothetical protein DQQ10_17315 [Pseudochryseolinea flava]